MHLSVIISIFKYLHRLENASDGLLKDSYISTKYMSHEGLQSWYTSAIYILQLLELKVSSCRNLKIVSEYDQEIPQSQTADNPVCMEPYLSLTNFHHRQAICKICISAHRLMIEFGRYHKPKPIPREERLCRNCSLNEVEN